MLHRTSELVFFFFLLRPTQRKMAFSSNRKGVTVGWRKLHAKELHNFLGLRAAPRNSAAT